MSSPVLGYVFDDTAKTIRTISGVPGAASFGDTVPFPGALLSAFVYSGARVAVATVKEGGLVLISWGGSAQVAAMETSLNPVTQAAFSRSGKRVALSDGTTVEVWKIDATPTLLSRNHPDQGAGILALAVNDEGAVAAASVTGRIVRFGAGDSQSISTSGDWSALAFSHDGNDIFAADAARNELVRMTSDGGRVVIATLPEAASALAISDDENNFAVALSSSLLVISASGAVTPVACGCRPKGLDPLQGGLAVQVRGTALVLDADGDGPRLTTLLNLFAVNAGGSN
jgi:hypothetical protein